MQAIPTRTLNPLPFGDLEPHRFEDLVRQIAYEFRRWKSLEAIGRSGTDEGIDIRGTELYEITDEDPSDDSEENASQFLERVWTFQCKREKSLSPKQIRTVVDESLRSFSQPPYGFILSCSCDISKKGRDAFREEMVSRKIEEFFIWSRGELEDMLFQPKHDRLLFAYFGISLQVRRTSNRAAIRSKISKKKQLISLINEKDGDGDKIVLLRDASLDHLTGKPGTSNISQFCLCKAVSAKRDNSLLVLCSEYFAAITPDRDKWDAFMGHDHGQIRFRNEISRINLYDPDRKTESSIDPGFFWREYIPESERATLEEYRWVDLDRILAIDPAGDYEFPVPHIYVDFQKSQGLFTRDPAYILRAAGYMERGIELRPKQENRVKIFPAQLPTETDPPLKEFSQKSAVERSLSSDTALQLDKLLTDVKTRRAKKVTPPQPSVPQIEKHLEDFHSWKLKIGLPVFSTFMTKLCNDGNFCNIVTRPREKPSFAYSEDHFLELSFSLNMAGSVHNPNYRPTGSVKIKMLPHGPKLSVWPSPKDFRGHEAQPDSPKLESMTAEFLEQTLIGTLRRAATDTNVI